MFGSFLPSLGCMTTIKSTQVEGADILMKSSGGANAVAGCCRLLGVISPKPVWGQCDKLMLVGALCPVQIGYEMAGSCSRQLSEDSPTSDLRGRCDYFLRSAVQFCTSVSGSPAPMELTMTKTNFVPSALTANQ